MSSTSHYRRNLAFFFFVLSTVLVNKGFWEIDFGKVEGFIQHCIAIRVHELI